MCLRMYGGTRVLRTILRGLRRRKASVATVAEVFEGRDYSGMQVDFQADMVKQ